MSETKHHPLVAALIDTLPAAGSEWPHADRGVWLQMATMAFALAYKANDAPELRIVNPSLVVATPRVAAPAEPIRTTWPQQCERCNKIRNDQAHADECDRADCPLS